MVRKAKPKWEFRATLFRMAPAISQYRWRLSTSSRPAARRPLDGQMAASALGISKARASHRDDGVGRQHEDQDQQEEGRRFEADEAVSAKSRPPFLVGSADDAPRTLRKYSLVGRWIDAPRAKCSRRRRAGRQLCKEGGGRC